MRDINTLAKSLIARLERGDASATVIAETRHVLEKYVKQDLLLPVLSVVKKQLQQKQLYNTVIIETPFAVSETMMQDIAIKITGQKNVETIQIHKPELLAGFRAKYLGTIHDASARKHITQLQKLY
jgi:F0F1-type ATP synthase delta subunit